MLPFHSSAVRNIIHSRISDIDEIAFAFLQRGDDASIMALIKMISLSEPDIAPHFEVLRRLRTHLAITRMLTYEQKESLANRDLAFATKVERFCVRIARELNAAYIRADEKFQNANNVWVKNPNDTGLYEERKIAEHEQSVIRGICATYWRLLTTIFDSACPDEESFSISRDEINALKK